MGAKRVDGTDNFFELGGNLLLGLKVLSRVRALKSAKRAVIGKDDKLFRTPNTAQDAVILLIFQCINQGVSETYGRGKSTKNPEVGIE